MSHRNSVPPLAAAAVKIAPADSAARPCRPKRLGLKDSSVFLAARRASGLTQAEYAAELGTRPQLVHEHENPTRPHTPTYWHIDSSPRESALVMLRALAAHKAALVIDAPAVVHGEDHVGRGVVLTVELTDVLREHATRTADGVLCKNDNAPLLKEVREAISALLEYEAKLVSEGE